MADDDQIRRLSARVADCEDGQRANAHKIASLGNDVEANKRKIWEIELRQADRLERLQALERNGRASAPSAQTQQGSAWADIPLKILIAAMLVGMALGRAGFDPGSWFR